MLALANNRDETVIQAELDLLRAGHKYARDALQEPAFLRIHWKAMLAAWRRQLRQPYPVLSCKQSSFGSSGTPPPGNYEDNC